MKNLQLLLSVLECRCGGNVTVSNETIVCEKGCGKEFVPTTSGLGVISEELYKVEDKTSRPLNISATTLDRKGGSWRTQNYRLTRDWVNKFSHTDLLLDVGCGPLINQELLRERSAIYVDGGDYDGVNLVCDFSKSLPMKQNSIDGMLCSNVIEHLPEPQVCFDEMHRVIKPGGEALILVPFVIKLHQEPYDFHRYTKYALKFYAQKAGFSIIEVREVGGISNILGTILNCAIKESVNPIYKLGLHLQRSFLRVLRKFFDDDSPSIVLPQGYALYLKKN